MSDKLFKTLAYVGGAAAIYSGFKKKKLNVTELLPSKPPLELNSRHLAVHLIINSKGLIKQVIRTLAKAQIVMQVAL